MGKIPRCSCAHGRMLDAFDRDTEVWLSEREKATGEHSAEMRAWEERNPRPLLGEYMKMQGRF